MSLKIIIPEVSLEYKHSLAECLQHEESNLYVLLNLISGYTQGVEISITLGSQGLGGAKTIEALIESSSGFKQATLKEYKRFYEDGYSGGDFQHIFLDAYLSTRFDILYSGLLLKE